MFNTVAAAGGQEGEEGTGKNNQVVNRGVDLQQLTSIIESLNPQSEPWDAVRIYRMAHEHGRGNVTYESFTVAATRVNFFSRCLRLPVHYGSALTNDMSMLQCAQLGEVVRKHAALVGTMVEEFAYQFLNEEDASKLRRLYGDVCDELAKGKLVLDGRRALCAQRRLLEFMLRRRADSHEQVRLSVCLVFCDVDSSRKQYKSIVYIRTLPFWWWTSEVVVDLLSSFKYSFQRQTDE
jgi:hypothetical protein